jgi:hypothetical protein
MQWRSEETEEQRKIRLEENGETSENKTSQEVEEKAD